MDKLLEKYISVLIKQGEALEKGDSRTANKCYDKIKKLHNEIKKRESYVTDMEELLLHENNYVKLDAAYNLLPILTKKAEDALNELANLKRGAPARFDAEMTLKEWKKGNLTF